MHLCGLRGFCRADYVDDLYTFVDSVDSAEHLLRKLIPELRSYDLVLNEAKSKIIPATALHSEEPDLEALFEAAVQEVSDQIEDEDFDADYGFQSDWDEDEDMGGEEPTPTSQPLGNEGDGDDDLEASQPLHLAATEVLFDSIDSYPCCRRRQSEPCAGFAVSRLERTETQARRRPQLVCPGSVAGRQLAQFGVGANIRGRTFQPPLRSRGTSKQVKRMPLRLTFATVHVSELMGID